jgi:putative ABC transport system permease protein
MIRPPRLAQRLLSIRLARDERDELIGDLDEQFMRRAASGAASARRWYWGQTFALVWGFAIHRRDLISTSHERTRGYWALSNIMFDWRQAARSLHHSPAFALVALLTLVLGVGLSTAVFSMVNGILLQPLPIRDAARVVRLGELEPAQHAMFDGMINAGPSSRIGLKDVSVGVWQAMSTTIAAFAPLSTNEVNVTTPVEPARVMGAEVGPQFFDVFPLTPTSGRLLTAVDAAATADPVVLVTDRFWSERLGRRADVLDLVIRVEDVPTRIVGVVPATLDFLEPGIDLIRPGHFMYPDPGRQRMFSMSMDVAARMKPGVELEAVRAEGQQVLRTIAMANPAFFDGNVPVPKAIVEPLQDDVVGPVRPGLTLLCAAIVCVLVGSCVNLASLLLARNTARHQDVAVRLALGASRWRIVRPLLFEQLLLGGVGGAFGWLLAAWILKLLPMVAPADLPRLADVRFDLTSLAFAAATALVTAIVVGILPAWQIPSSRVHAFASQPAGTPSAASGMRSTLVVCQVALATVLIVGAALIGRSLIKLVHVDPGYRPDGVLTFQIAQPDMIWRDKGHLHRFFGDLEMRLSRNPAVIAVGHASSLPLISGGSAGTFDIEGRPRPEGDARPRGQHLGVTAGYLPAIGTRLLRGRFFTDQDTPTSEPVCLINDVFANKFFPGEEPIGNRLSVRARTYARIVGVVASAHIGELTSDAPPAVIELATQQPEILGYGHVAAGMAVRVTGDPEAIVPFVRETVRALEPTWPIYNIERMDDRLGRTFAQPRFYTVTLVLFASLALVTAILGLYGVLSYAVERRRREFGVRRALGADERRIVLLVGRRALGLALAGLVIGLAGATLGAQWLRAVLFGVQPLDPASYLAAIAIVFLVVVTASWTPVRRALRIDPARALRVD